MKSMLGGMAIGMIVAGAGSYLLYSKMSSQDMSKIKKDMKKMVKDSKKTLSNMGN